jgi:hypothetical protein
LIHGALRIFSRVSSVGVSIAISSYELFSIAVEAEEGGTAVADSFGSSSS